MTSLCSSSDAVTTCNMLTMGGGRPSKRQKCDKVMARGRHMLVFAFAAFLLLGVADAAVESING